MDQDNQTPDSETVVVNTTPQETTKPASVSKKELAEALEREKQERASQEAKLVQLEKDKKSMEAKLAALEESLSKKVSMPEAPKPVDPTPKDGEAYLAFIQQQQAQNFQLLTQQLEQKSKEQSDRLQKLKDDLDAKELALVRAEVTKGLKFPELVKGSTPEELRKSAEESRKREDEVLKGIREEAAKEAAKNLPRNGVPSPSGIKSNKTSASGVAATEMAKKAADAKKQIEARKLELQKRMGLG